MYNKKYDKSDIRSNNTDFVDFALPYLSQDFELIDLGCGTCKKTLPISRLVSRVDAIDRNRLMLKQAARNVARSANNNIRLVLADNINTPFLSHIYDACICTLSTWSPIEVHRLLKPNGLFLLETLSPDDKAELKAQFGSDEVGYRGYYLNQTHEERLLYLQKSLEPFFVIEEAKLVERETELTRRGFIDFLQTTPTIRDFSMSRDKHIVNRLSAQGSVKFTEKRIMIRARARDIL